MNFLSFLYYYIKKISKVKGYEMQKKMKYGEIKEKWFKLFLKDNLSNAEKRKKEALEKIIAKIIKGEKINAKN